MTRIYFITQLGFGAQSIHVFPNTEEKCISFSKHISKNFQVRFIDTLLFMPASLEKLAQNLISPTFHKFRETSKIFFKHDLSLVTRKGFYPYEYTDCWEKLNNTSLPLKQEFYSTLTESSISVEDYDHSLNVWKKFNFKTLGEFSDWYMTVDVMFFCDFHENFRDSSIETYELDPNYYYTAPGISFDCMLKITQVELELLSDYDKIFMLETGIRGG